MKLRVTSITSSEVGEKINSIATGIEDRLQPQVESRDYGGSIQEFFVFFVSVDSDPLQNERYCHANNRASRYKDILTGKMVSFVGIAIPVDPELVLNSSQEALSKLLECLLLEELKAPAYALPKKLDRQKLLTDISSALAGGPA